MGLGAAGWSGGARRGCGGALDRPFGRCCDGSVTHGGPVGAAAAAITIHYASGPGAEQNRVSNFEQGFIKLGFGTSALYPRRLLQEKVALIRAFDVEVYPGGTLVEAAVSQDRGPQCLRRIQELGFTAVEISDGTVPVRTEERRSLIAAARELGFRVLTEVGKKDTSTQPDPSVLAAQARADLETGAEYVIVEGRESGAGVGIYDPEGTVQGEALDILSRALPPDTIIWEAPRKEQQQELIARFGTNVSLGNVAPADAVALEALRVGLRGDTLRLVLQK